MGPSFRVGVPAGGPTAIMIRLEDRRTLPLRLPESPRPGRGPPPSLRSDGGSSRLPTSRLRCIITPACPQAPQAAAIIESSPRRGSESIYPSARLSAPRHHDGSVSEESPSLPPRACPVAGAAACLSHRPPRPPRPSLLRLSSALSGCESAAPHHPLSPLSGSLRVSTAVDCELSEAEAPNSLQGAVKAGMNAKTSLKIRRVRSHSRRQAQPGRGLCTLARPRRAPRTLRVSR